MCTRRFLLPAAILMCVLPGSQLLSAGVIFDNLSQAGSDFRIAYSYPSDHLWGESAQRFSTGSNAYELTQVTLYMQGVVPGGLVVALHAAGAGIPGASIATLSGLDTPSTSDFGMVRFDGGGNLLAANTTYWIVMRPTSGNYSWGASSDPSAGTGLMRMDWSPDWSPGPIDTLGNQIMKVEADAVGAVPEPSTLLLCLPALALCLRRRARR